MPALELTDHMFYMLEMALDDNSYMNEWYFDLKNNEVTSITEYDDLEEEEELKQLIEEDVDGERFIYISPVPGSENWQQMEDFILEQEDLDNTVQSLLLTAIQGRGAFRRFDDAIEAAGIRGRWFEYKNRLDRKKALRWLKDHKLISDEGVAEGLKMLDNAVARRKRIENARKAMKKGEQVVCSAAHAHADKITPGKTYDILDERPHDQLIRIKDDRGKIIWLTKNHFDLV